MRLSLPRLTIFLALGVSPTATAFTIPSNTIAPALSTPFTQKTALYAKKKKGNAAKDAALAALEALEAAEQNTGATTAIADPFDDDEPMSKKDMMKAQKKAKKGGAAAAANVPDLDALLTGVEDEPLSKKEQMALEKKRQKEAKKQQNDEERKMKEEMEEMEKNKRKKALKVSCFVLSYSHLVCIGQLTYFAISILQALAEMEAAEKSAGTINESEEEEAGPPMSKKEAKEAAKAAAKQEEKMAKKAMKKKAKQMGITVEELEAMEAEGGDVDEFGLETAPEAVNGEVRIYLLPLVDDMEFNLTSTLHINTTNRHPQNNQQKQLHPNPKKSQPKNASAKNDHRPVSASWNPPNPTTQPYVSKISH